MGMSNRALSLALGAACEAPGPQSGRQTEKARMTGRQAWKVGLMAGELCEWPR